MSGKLGVEIAALVEENLRLVPDFPMQGVLFRDITPLFANGPAFAELVALLANRYAGKIDMVAGLESRGFILAAPLAAELGIGMIAIRKAGKLPGPVVGVDYALEYGTGRLEVQPASVPKDSRVLVLDDVLATGGTAKAACDLLSQCGAHVVEVAVLMELIDLKGKDKLAEIPFVTAVQVREQD
ncbi:adenine phosphoribosyltransferase [Actinomycetaceae bacterium WB03_NA08]|uniref:Adenine phosphoribosyltransferase n=1 Tax=Scrofimicrobium canadense TaxID=2652290 RepID=A0A6N7VP76_9ACTO|nr:adenine phosphoribosyltransferase [Scrofimicrobium canadense]MSS83507.1 adenine phosphoribosyltransferase [Scrofimicrobium canadense]